MSGDEIALSANVSLAVTAGIATLYKSETGRVAQLNAAGSQCLLALLNGGKEQDVVELIADQLEKSVGVVSSSLRELIDDLLDEGWIRRSDQR